MSTTKKGNTKNTGAALTSRFLDIVRGGGAPAKPAAAAPNAPKPTPASAGKPAIAPTLGKPDPAPTAGKQAPVPVGKPVSAPNAVKPAPAPAPASTADQTTHAPIPEPVAVKASSTQPTAPAAHVPAAAAVAPVSVAPSNTLPLTAAQNAAGRTPKEIIEQMLADSRAIGEPVDLRLPITPEFADYLLSINEDNRGIAPVKLDQYAEDMAAGRWQENGEGISISIDGKLNNGQHRSHAIKRTGTTQIMTVTVGVTRESRGTNDIGKGKTPGDHLGMDGHTNSRALAAVGRMIVSYRDAGRSSLGRASTISTPRLQSEIAADPRIEESTTFAVKHQKAIKPFATNTILGFMHHTLSAIDPVAAQRFLDGILTSAEDGIGINTDDPRYRARATLQGMMKNNNPPERVEVLMRAWNMWRQGRKITSKIQVRGKLPDPR